MQKGTIKHSLKASSSIDFAQLFSFKRMNMGALKNKTIWLLLVVSLAPILVMGWFAISSLRAQQSESQIRFEAIQITRIQKINRIIADYIIQLENKLISNKPSSKNASLFIDQNPLVIASFWLDFKGVLQYPKEPLSEQEVQFLQRTKLLFSDQVKLDVSGATESASTTLSIRNEPTILVAARNRTQGWIPWFWEDGLHLIYWMRTEQGVIGVEVDRIAILAQLIAILPEVDENGGQFILKDESSRILHSFGGAFKNANNIQDFTVASTQALAYPLQSWIIEYKGPVQQWREQFIQADRRNLLIKFSALGVVLLAIGFWLYREGSRSLREARARVDFVNQVSHELKTPLTNIRLYAELLESKVEDSDREKLQIIQSESERLSRMILNILTFSRKERRKLNLSRTQVYLPEIIQECMDVFSLRMEKRGLKMTLLGEAPREILLDPDAARQIISNLLSNAEKYAAGGLEIQLKLEQDAQSTTLHVQDFGPGIPLELQHKIFEPFYRINHRLDEGVSGTGIGLHIAQSLAELQEGTLQLSASAKGACFTWRMQL